MSLKYGQFNEDKTDKTGSKVEFMVPNIDKSAYNYYPTVIKQAKFPSEEKNVEDNSNYFDFKGINIPQYCKEYEKKMLPKPIIEDFLNDKTAEEKLYKSMNEYLNSKFFECNDEVIVESNNQNPKAESIVIENISRINTVILSLDESKVYSHKNESLVLYDINKKKEIPLFASEGKNKSTILAIRMSNDGKTVFSLCEEEIKVFDATTGKLLNTISNLINNSDFTQMFLSPDGDSIYVGFSSGKILEYHPDSEDQNEDFELEGHEEKITCFAISQREDSEGNLISGSEDNTIRVWKISKQKELFILKKHLDAVTDIEVTSDSTKIVSVGLDGRIIIWDIVTGKDISTIIINNAKLYSAKLFPDDSKIIIGLEDGLEIWDLQSRKNMFALVDHGYEISSIQMTKDGSKVISAGDDNQIRIWNIGLFENRELIYEEKRKENDVLIAAMTPNGLYLAAINNKQELILWDIKNKKQKATLKGHTSEIVAVTTSLDSNQIISAEKKNIIKFWSVSTLKIINTLNLDPPISQLIFKISFDNNYLIAFDDELSVWSINDNKKITSDRIYCTALAAPTLDFSFFLAGLDNGEIVIYEDPLNLLERTTFLTEHFEPIDQIVITPDNKKFISISLVEKWLVIWDKEKKILIKKLNADFQNFSIFFPWFKEGRNFASINNFLLDLNNNTYLSKYRTYSKNSRQLYSDTEKFILDLSINDENMLKVEKIAQFFSHDILQSCFLLQTFFKNPQDDQDNNYADIYDGSSLLFPFKWNFLHIVAVTGNEQSFNIKNFPEDLNVPMNAILAKDFLENNCFDILIILKKKELFKKFFQLYTKAYNSEQSAFYYKTKLFEYEYNKSRNENLYAFFSKILDFFGDTILLSQLLDLSYINYSEFQGMDYVLDELDQSYYCAVNDINFFDRIEKVKEFLEKKQEKKKTNKPTDNKRQAVCNVKVISLENCLDINQESVNFNEKILDFGVSNPIFSNKVLEILINYKWNCYARDIYLKDMKYFMLFFIMFLINYIWIFPSRINDESTDTTLEVTSCILDCLLISYFIYYLYREITQFLKDSQEYLSSGYNYIDIGLIISSLTTFFMDILDIFGVSIDDGLIKLFASLTTFLFWLRVISYMRGFEGTAFMIRLIVEVVLDIRYFLLLILLFTLSFMCSIYVIQSNFDQNDSSYDNLFNMFTLCYRLVLGDYTNYDELSVEYGYYLWLMMIIFTLLLTIILLNLLISLIGNTFSSVLASKNSTRTYELMNIISGNGGIDSQLTTAQKKQMRDQNIIGKYLFCFFNNPSDEQMIENNEFMKTVLETNKFYSKKLEQMESKMNENADALDEKIEKLQNEFSSNSNKLVKISRNLTKLLNFIDVQQEKENNEEDEKKNVKEKVKDKKK